MDGVIEALVVRRTYRHPRETVFKAWTEPARLEKWFCPNPNNRVKADIDLRIGGVYRIQMIPASGDPWVVGGVYNTIDRPSDLGFTWRWEDSAEGASQVDVEFRTVGEGTEVVVNHSRLESEESRDNHGQGWNATMGRLMEYLDDPMEGMHMTAPDIVTAAAQVKMAKEVAQMALARLRDTFTHVPEDKAAWSPAEGSKNSLVITAHTCFANQYFASVLRGDPDGRSDMHESVRKINERAAQFTSHAEVLALLDQTTEEVLRSFDQVDPTRLTTDPRVNFVLTLVGRHTDGHASQIDYLQTIWGDHEDHFGL